MEMSVGAHPYYPMWCELTHKTNDIIESTADELLRSEHHEPCWSKDSEAHFHFGMVSPVTGCCRRYDSSYACNSKQQQPNIMQKAHFIQWKHHLMQLPFGAGYPNHINDL